MSVAVRPFHDLEDRRKKLITVIESQRIVTELYEDFPKKTAEARKRHVVVKDSCEVEQKIEANTRTVPGILTNRGCAFAGSKGVVFGPVKDILHLVHGPIGCAYFTWGMRRNLMKAEEGQDNFGAYCLSTDVKETDIVFGSEKKLAKAIRRPTPSSSPDALRSSPPVPSASSATTSSPSASGPKRTSRSR